VSDAAFDPVAVLDRQRQLVAEATRRADERRDWERRQAALAAGVRRTLAVLHEVWEPDDLNDLLKYVRAFGQFVAAIEACGVLYDCLADETVDASAVAITRLYQEQQNDPMRLRINAECKALLKDDRQLAAARTGFDRMAALATEALQAETRRRFPAEAEKGVK
jgi:hypothetical protein